MESINYANDHTREMRNTKVGYYTRTKPIAEGCPRGIGVPILYASWMLG